MQFDTKIAVVVRSDLEVWQKLNVASFLAGGIAAAFADCIGDAYEDGSGTKYLALIGQPIRTAIVPLVGRITAPPPPGASIRDAIERTALMFIQEIVSTPRADIVRLIIAEGVRFPAIADFYY